MRISQKFDLLSGDLPLAPDRRDFCVGLGPWLRFALNVHDRRLDYWFAIFVANSRCRLTLFGIDEFAIKRVKILFKGM